MNFLACFRAAVTPPLCEPMAFPVRGRLHGRISLAVRDRWNETRVDRTKGNAPGTSPVL